MCDSVHVNDSDPAALVIVATPIGDVADASPAMREALARCDVIAAEDTRRLKALLRRMDLTITAPVVSYYDANEASRSAELVAAVQDGKTVCVVSDAGMPLVSDPGYRVVQEAIAAGLRVRVIPGPSAVLAALAVSGLPTDRFCFEGFVPRKTQARRRRFSDNAHDPRTMVYFEAPHRLADFLDDAVAVFGPQRPAAVCRELTKTYEEVRRGPLAELAEWSRGDVLGEITVVIGGAPAVVVSLDDAVVQVMALVNEGQRLSQAVSDVAVSASVPRKELYRQALATRDQQRSGASTTSGKDGR